ncbi:methyltransferase [Allobaculum sp. Allo2]|uniref:methyltransferase n=1 Tax=Allobaculum sp. Allo2 TaxID=2853432 RepID=UPI00211264E4|nr:methyltransferase [Allobaculum sp. Allo2]
MIGVILSRFHPCKITGIDPNAQACHLARENYAANHVDGTIMEADHINDALYDSIVLNPPIRTGKTVIYSLFAQAYDHLKEGGTLYIVIRKQHGAQSAVDYLESLGFEVERPLREKGFWVLEAVK